MQVVHLHTREGGSTQSTTIWKMITSSKSTALQRIITFYRWGEGHLAHHISQQNVAWEFWVLEIICIIMQAIYHKGLPLVFQRKFSKSEKVNMVMPSEPCLSRRADPAFTPHAGSAHHWAANSRPIWIQLLRRLPISTGFTRGKQTFPSTTLASAWVLVKCALGHCQFSSYTQRTIAP